MCSRKRFKKWTTAVTQTSSTLSSVPSTHNSYRCGCVLCVLKSCYITMLACCCCFYSAVLSSAMKHTLLCSPLTATLILSTYLCYCALLTCFGNWKHNSGKWSLLIGRLCCVFARHLILSLSLVFFFFFFSFGLQSWLSNLQHTN